MRIFTLLSTKINQVSKELPGEQGRNSCKTTPTEYSNVYIYHRRYVPMNANFNHLHTSTPAPMRRISDYCLICTTLALVTSQAQLALGGQARNSWPGRCDL
jgi:hypothetical protein